MRRRWSRAAVVACILLLAAACGESARPLAPTKAAGDGGGVVVVVRPRSAFDVVVAGLVGIGLGQRWRPGGTGDELVDDEKRRVPTGPNPLHNR
uniref:Uncharacterized protein n=1 Tax=Oryza punctata TaxID=4537 RepID=A0A0E0KW78_ORYPU